MTDDGLGKSIGPLRSYTLTDTHDKVFVELDCDATYMFEMPKEDVKKLIHGLREMLEPWPSEIAAKKEADWERTKALITGGLFLALVIAVWSFNP